LIAGTNGSISSPGDQVYNCGSNATYTATPNTCYSVQSLIVDGVPQGAGPSFTFSNITANHTIVAQFVQRQFTINATAGAGGTTNPMGITTINCGGNLPIIIMPEPCYSISDVVVDGISQGVIGSFTFSNVKTDHTFSAQFSLNHYTITATAGTGGSISPGTSTIDCGSSQTFIITPNSCYSISDVIVDGVSQGAIGSYTFSNITANHTIVAQFAQIQYTIDASAGTGGSINPAGRTTINCGSSQEYSITPNSCYSITNVIVDSEPKGAISSYTFSNITANHTIVAQFVLKQYTITASAGSGGTINPMGITTINCGGSQQFTITPNSCYSISNVIVDGVPQGAASLITLSNVIANHTISAQFSQNQYTITASASAGGTISPNGMLTLNCGTTQTYSISPGSCTNSYDVKVDGVSQGNISAYSFSNIMANHTIEASFNQKQYRLTLYIPPLSPCGYSYWGGRVTPSGTITVMCGASTQITADSTESFACPPGNVTNLSFNHWQILNGSVTFSNQNSAATTVTLMSGDATIQPVYQ